MGITGKSIATFLGIMLLSMTVRQENEDVWLILTVVVIASAAIQVVLGLWQKNLGNTEDQNSASQKNEGMMKKMKFKKPNGRFLKIGQGVLTNLVTTPGALIANDRVRFYVALPSSKVTPQLAARMTSDLYEAVQSTDGEFKVETIDGYFTVSIGID